MFSDVLAKISDDQNDPALVRFLQGASCKISNDRTSCTTRWSGLERARIWTSSSSIGYSPFFYSSSIVQLYRLASIVWYVQVHRRTSSLLPSFSSSPIKEIHREEGSGCTTASAIIMMTVQRSTYMARLAFL